ncbi:MAG: flagellar filament capping protein FliD [Bryobacteraceae bacterium]|nr:flagellar filament capping protein FliD [Bryobacteraceae bacterium]
MGIAPLRFTGISQFSQDFQVIVDRTVQIASLPARALQNDQAALLEKKSAMAGLRSVVGGLAASLRGLDQLGVNRALSAASSQASTAAVTLTRNGAAAAPGSFTISEITSLAQRTIATSTTGWPSADSGPVSGPAGVLELVVGGQSFELAIDPAQNHPAGVRNAINAAGAGVTATLLNVNGQVFLSLSANQTGAAAIELRTEPGEASTNLLSVTQAGLDAVFKVNGQTVTSSENYVEGVIPGAAITLKGLTAGNETVLVEVTSSRAPVLAALKGFVTAFNQINESMAQAGSALRGEPLVNSVFGLVRQVTSQFGEGGVRNLAEIGVSVDRQGVMSLDESAFATLPAARMDDVFRFFRASEQGIGSLANGLQQLSDPIDGAMAAQIRSWDETDARLQGQIESIFERVSATQATLLVKLQAADALLARLEGQQSLLEATVKSLQFTTYGRQER